MYCIYERLCILGVLGRKILCYKFIRSWLREKTPSEKNINLLHYITLCVGHIFLGFWSSGSWNHGGDLFDQLLHPKHQSRLFNYILHEYFKIFHWNVLAYWNFMLVLKRCYCLCDSSYWASSYWKFELLKIRVIEDSSYWKFELSKFDVIAFLDFRTFLVWKCFEE